MANEILVSGITDLVAAEVMSGEYLRLLAEQDDFFGHPALVYVGAADGSNVIKTPAVGLGGYDLLVSGTDGTDPGNTALTDAHYDVTVAPYEKIYEQSDLARFISQGRLDPVLFAQDAAISIAQTLVSLIAALSSGFSSSVGSTGVDATIQNHVDAITQLEINKVGGRYLAVYSPRSWGDIRTDSLSLGGAAQYREDSQGLVMAGMGQNKGSLFGVDCFVSSHVPTANAGADRSNMMFGRGAVLWGDARVQTDGDPNIVSLGDRATFERDRNGRAGLTAYVTRAYLGAAEGIDLAGCKIVTDA